jgi:hypothetical protein
MSLESPILSVNLEDSIRHLERDLDTLQGSMMDNAPRMDLQTMLHEFDNYRDNIELKSLTEPLHQMVKDLSMSLTIHETTVAEALQRITAQVTEISESIRCLQIQLKFSQKERVDDDDTLQQSESLPYIGIMPWGLLRRCAPLPI